MLLPFPADFPTEALPVLLDYLRKKIPVGAALNAGWNLLGYAGGKLPGSPQLLSAPMTDAELADSLESQLAVPANAQALGVGPFGGLIAGLIAEALRRLMAKWLGG